MATVENLKIAVDVNIASAISNLEELQEELGEVANAIKGADAVGSEGIDVRTSIDEIDDDLAQMSAKMEAWEATNSLDITTDMDQAGRMFDFNESRDPFRSFAGPMFDADLAALAGGADFGGFNVPRGRGITRTTGGGDGISGLRARFRDLRKTLGNVQEGMMNFDLRMSDIHNAMARLVPVLLLVVGAIPAAITAIYGLAAAAIAATAAFAAIAGFGALGVGLQDGQFSMDRLTNVLEDIRGSFIDAFAPLAERLEPLFRDAVDGLEQFFQVIANEGDALMALTDEAQAFGRFMVDFVPGALRDMAALVEGLDAAFAGIGQFLDREFTNMMRTVVQVTADAVPIVAELAVRIGRAVPAIVEFSIGMAKLVNILFMMIGGLMRLLGVLGVTPQLFGALVGAMLLAATTALLLNSALLTTAFNGLVKLGAMILGHIGRLLGLSAANVVATLATWGLYQALAALLALTGIGLVLVGLSAGVSAMGSSFASAATDVDSLTNSLKDFNRVSGGTGTDGFNPYGMGQNGAAAADVGMAPHGTGGQTVINIESSGDPERDRGNARYASWRQGRTTGSNN